MIETKPFTKIDFAPVTLEVKRLYEAHLAKEGARGCEFSFANVYMWGEQKYAVLFDHIILFSRFGRRNIYPYPLGNGDKKAVLDLIIADAGARGIPCILTGLSDAARETVETLYPERFQFYYDDGSFDYVYAIDDLAELKGKKYHGKRNHLNRFLAEFPDYTVEALDESNLSAVKRMAEQWYASRTGEDTEADFYMEKEALAKAFDAYRALEMEGLVLRNGDDVLAFTLASRLSDDTFDVHFEKARPDAPGAYTAINYELARHIRSKYPDVLYLDREEDMGIEGLRKAKQSYHPHHMVRKCRACLLEDGYDS